MERDLASDGSLGTLNVRQGLVIILDLAITTKGLDSIYGNENVTNKIVRGLSTRILQRIKCSNSWTPSQANNWRKEKEKSKGMMKRTIRK